MTSPETTTQPGVPADTLSARLMLARLHAGNLTIREAAMRCGIKHESWSGWERGGRPRDLIDVAERVSEHLGIDRDWLLFGGPLAKEDRRAGRVVSHSRKEGAAAEPNVFYLGASDRTGCVPDRPMRGQPTPASQGSPSPSRRVKHSGATRPFSGSPLPSDPSQQRRARRRNRPLS